MKKVLFFLITTCILLSIVGCSSNTNSIDTTEQTTNPEVVSETTQSLPNKGGSKGGLGGDSLDTSAVETQYLDVAYGTLSPTQTLNIYLPNQGEGPFPVIVAIHGGAFKMGSATGGDVAAMLEGINRGYAVVSINYRLSNEAIFPAAVNDCKAAIRFIKANAEQFRLDATKIAVWGDSAGGNLASMIGTTGNVDTLNGDNLEHLNVGSDVQAVVNWFGPLDFLAMDEQFAASGITPVFGKTSSDTSPESQYIGQLITIDPEMTQKANPSTYISTMNAAEAPSFLVQHGTADANVPTQQSVDFASKLMTALGENKVSIYLLEGAGHGTSEFTSQENLDLVYAFLDSVLK